MKFTIMGYTVETAEQARTVLVVAKLKGERQAVQQAMSVIKQFEAA